MTLNPDTQTRGGLRISKWSLAKIAASVDGEVRAKSPASTAPLRVCTDTRQLAAADLFVALSGENFDGHAFLGKAAESACAAIVEDGRFEAHLPSDSDLPLIVVEDCLVALSKLGHALWSEATLGGMHTVAVTGSNGKTTTKEMLACLWGLVGTVHSTPGNLNNHIGVPLTLCALPEVCDHLIVEMGANAPGEIAGLVQLAPAQERIITSIGHAHIEGFGSLDGIRRAKSEIFQAGGQDTVAIAPFTEISKLDLEGFEGRVISFGVDEGAQVRFEFLAGNATVSLSTDSQTWTLELPLPGVHNAMNLAAALATLVARGVAPDEVSINMALSGLTLPSGRWRCEAVGPFYFVDDAYNANPSSVLASFGAFMGFEPEAGSRDKPCRVAIIGEMRELGEAAPTLHEEVAAAVAAAPELDAFVAVGAYARQMAAAARALGRDDLEVVAASEPAEVASWLVNKESALVFLKASRGSRLERVIEILKKTRTESSC